MSATEDDIQPLTCWPPPEEDNLPENQTNNKNEGNRNGNISIEGAKQHDSSVEELLPRDKKRFKAAEGHSVSENNSSDGDDIDDDIVTADVAVARWWRKRQKTCLDQKHIPSRASAHTLLVHVMRFVDSTHIHTLVCNFVFL